METEKLKKGNEIHQKIEAIEIWLSHFDNFITDATGITIEYANRTKLHFMKYTDTNSDAFKLVLYVLRKNKLDRLEQLKKEFNEL